METTTSPKFVNDKRPQVQLPCDDRLVSDFAHELGKHLAEKDIFRRGGRAFIPSDTKDGLIGMDSDTLRTWVEDHLVCYKTFRPGGKELIEYKRTMSVTDADAVLSSPQFIGQLQPIEKFNTIRMPVYDRYGYLKLLDPGYDEFTKTYTAESAVAVTDRVPMEMARTTIDDLFKEFPFADSGRSKSVAIASMLTVFAQGMLPQNSLRPCFIAMANTEGAGKTLLVKCATVPVLGYSPTGTKPKDEDEMRKTLLAAVMEAKSVLCFDNIKGRLASESLEGFLTSQNWAGRVLGGSRTFSGQNNVTVFVTGNGCTVSPDMRRRSLFCELFVEAERAEDRIFSNQLEVPQLIERRGEILSALYSFILAWHQAMEPKPSRSHSSFPDWARIIGGIVEHAGYACPLETPKIEGAMDVDGSDMRELVSTLGDGCLEKALKFSEIVDAAREKGLFDRIIQEDGDIQPGARSALAKLLGTYDRRIIGEYRFAIDGKGHKRTYKITKESKT